MCLSASSPAGPNVINSIHCCHGTGQARRRRNPSARDNRSTHVARHDRRVITATLTSDVIALVVFWRLRYKLSLRDLPEMFLIRGIEFTHEAVRDWEAKLTPALAEGLRRHRRGKVGRGWYVDETYIKVNGQW